jgi:hypothetical protein
MDKGKIMTQTTPTAAPGVSAEARPILVYTAMVELKHTGMGAVALPYDMATALHDYVERLESAPPAPEIAILKEQLNACNATLQGYYLSDDVATQGVARHHLAALLDIWDDGKKPHEHRAYVDGAFAHELEEARQYLYTTPPPPVGEPQGVTDLEVRQVWEFLTAKNANHVGGVREALEQFLAVRAMPGAVITPLVAAPQAAEPGLSITQESKYTISGNAIVNRASGEAIPSDEPIFIFRARDRQACSILGEYAQLCENAAHREAVNERFIQFGEWADAHPERMKEPDTAVSPSAGAGGSVGAEPAAWMKITSLAGDDWDAYDFSANKHGDFTIPLYRHPVATPAAGVQGDAARDVLAERARQIEAEGWTRDHDNQHNDGDMAMAAACYALHAAGLYQVTSMAEPPEHWPWSYSDWKPKDFRRDLVRAAALLIAEIDHHDLAAQSTKGA